MLAAASGRKKSAEIKAEAGREKRQDYAKTVSSRLKISSLLILPLAYAGFSIGAREGIYRGDPLSNPMGTLNAFMTGFSGGLTLTFLTILTGWAGANTSDEGATFMAFGVIAGPIIGVIAGSILAAVTASREAFKENPFLYYLPSAAIGIAAFPILFRIWLPEK
jgi:hypothetical protein